MEDIANIEIEYDCYIGYKYKYVANNHYDIDGNIVRTSYDLSVSGTTNKMRIPIDGMITKNEYHDFRFYNDTAIVYVPIDKLKEIIRNNEGLKNRDVVIETD